MSADPKDLFEQTALLSEEVTRPFANSTRTYVKGTRPDMKVAMRAVSQAPTPSEGGGIANPPITLYDTSGPYTDPHAHIDLAAGLPGLRCGWIEQRRDTQRLAGRSAEYARDRLADSSLDGYRFPKLPVPRRAISGANVTQMHYARRGMVTPEMEYVAIRENARLAEMREEYHAAGLLRRHPGASFGARLPDEVTPEFVREEVAAASTTRRSSRWLSAGTSG